MIIPAARRLIRALALAVTSAGRRRGPSGTYYKRPDGTSYYLRPDGTSRYERP